VQNAQLIFAPKIWWLMKVSGSVVYIPLNKPKRNGKRKFAIVDADEAERVLRHKWYACVGGNTWYVRATSMKGLPAHHMALHAFIMRANKGDMFDHENGDGLDNRKDNLRPATAAQNARNTFKTTSPHVTSKFKGVSLTSSGRWLAQITLEGNPQCLGLFDAEEDAARAYDEAALRLFGQFAKTNADMGLYDAPKPTREIDYGYGAKQTTKSKLLGLPPKERWESFLDGSEPEIDRSIPRRIRQKQAARRRKVAA